MIIYNVDASVRDDIVAALRNVQPDERRLAGALGRRMKLEDTAVALAGIVAAWPAEDDGNHRIALSDAAGAVVWRSYAVAEIAAGRGRLADLKDYVRRLGIAGTESAFEYVCKQTKGQGVRPCADADHDCWSEPTQWIVADGRTPDPRRRWASSVWRARANAHGAYEAAGLVVAGRATWKPQATILFSTPEPEPVYEGFDRSDEDALATLGAC